MSDMELHALICAVLDKSKSQTELDPLWKKLLVELNTQTSHVVSCHARADAICSNLVLALLKGRFDPERAYSHPGATSAWLWRVIKNMRNDASEIRRQARGGDKPQRERVDPLDTQAELERTIDTDRSIKSLLSTVLAWKKHRPRFIVIAWYGLWDYLRVREMKQVLEGLRLTQRWPVAGFEAWSDVERSDYLARLLPGRRRRDVTAEQMRNTINQIRYRVLKQLKDDRSRGGPDS
jgi:hypothetical protein